jgi:hypothetical protein
LEDMLRACVLQYDKNWDKCLSLAEFSYNNSYQASIKMAPFEALYGRRCWTPLSWSHVAKPPELSRFKCVIIAIQPILLNALQTEQPIGLSGLRPIQPRFNRIEAGLPRTKVSLQSQHTSVTFNLQKHNYYYKPFSNLM